MATTLLRPETADAGTVEHCELWYGAAHGATGVVPMPRSPSILSPQHCTVPFDSSAQVPEAWAATAMTPERLDTVVEPCITPKLPNVPLPSSPQVLSPQ